MKKNCVDFFFYYFVYYMARLIFYNAYLSINTPISDIKHNCYLYFGNIKLLFFRTIIYLFFCINRIFFDNKIFLKNSRKKFCLKLSKICIIIIFNKTILCFTSSSQNFRFFFIYFLSMQMVVLKWFPDIPIPYIIFCSLNVTLPQQTEKVFLQASLTLQIHCVLQPWIGK